MKPNRLTRLIGIHTLLRRIARRELLTARQLLAMGRRARGLLQLRFYRRTRADIDECELDIRERIAALIK